MESIVHPHTSLRLLGIIAYFNYVPTVSSGQPRLLGNMVLYTYPLRVILIDLIVISIHVYWQRQD